MFCACQGHETFLCEGCYLTHYSKNLTKIHLALPMSEYGRERPQGYLERLQVRCINIPIAKEELRKCLQGIDSCIAGLAIETEKVITAVRDFSAVTLSQLQELRSCIEREISDSCAEVDATMHDDSPILQRELSRQIRSFAGDLSTLKHFTFDINSSQVLREIKSMCLYSMSTPMENPYLLPGVIGNKLSIYDVQLAALKTIPLSSVFSSGCQLAFIERDVLLVLGTTPASPKAFLIKVPSGNATETRQMHIARRFPGLIVVREFAYVFGGICKNSEKYKISNYSWANLPDMKKEKTGFSPCLYENDIYLYRADDNFEAFNILSEKFRAISLFSYNSLKNNNSLSVISGSEVIILTCSSEIGRFQIENSTLSVTTLEQFADANTPLSQSRPILMNRGVYYVSWSSGGVYSVNLDTKKCTAMLG